MKRTNVTYTQCLAVVIGLSLMAGCQYFGKKEADHQQQQSTVAIDTVSYDIEQTETKQENYVIDRNGTYFKEVPSDAALNLDFLPYASKLDIEGESGDYYKVMNYSTGYYAYVEKRKLGSLDQISLVNDDLTKMSYLKQENDKEPTFFEEKPGELKSFVSLRLIDKNTYQSAKQKAVNYFIADTTAIVKRGHTLTLPCAESPVVFKDVNPDTDSDNIEEFRYEGQIPPLNKFVVLANYNEGYDYKLIDKTTGKELSFSEFPYLSPDKRHILTLYANPHEGIIEMMLYAVDEPTQRIREIFSAGFKHWMSFNIKNEDAFWSTDGCFYLPVLHQAKYWTSEDKIRCQGAVSANQTYTVRSYQKLILGNLFHICRTRIVLSNQLLVLFLC